MRKNYRVLKAHSLKVSDETKNLKAVECMLYGRRRTFWYREAYPTFQLSDPTAKV
jgi:hypothetical protein